MRATDKPLNDMVAATMAAHRLGMYRCLPKGPTVKWLLAELDRLAAVMDAQGVANTAWGLAKMRVSPSHPLWQNIMRRFLSLNARDFKPQEIANLLWAFATAGVPPDAALVGLMSSAAVSKSKDFKPQAISNLMWAFSTMNVPLDTVLVQAMTSEAVSKSEQFEPQAISNLMWAFATSGVPPDAALVRAMSLAAVSKSTDFDPQAIANLMWALAKLGVPPDAALVRAMSSEAVLKSRDFLPQAMSNLMWALATLGVTPDVALVRAMSMGAVSKCGQFKPQAIANLVWAFATLGIPLDAVLVRAVSSEIVSCRKRTFLPVNISNLMWAFATLGVQLDGALVREMLNNCAASGTDAECKRQLHHFFLFNSLSPYPLDLSAWTELAAECKVAFVASSSSSAHISTLQKDVTRVLRRLVWEGVLEEQVLEDSGFSVDARLVGTRVVIEVDGPHHYLGGEAVEAGQGRVVDGSTQFKHRTLTQLGWTVLQVPYFDWNALSGAQDKTRYLATLLASTGVVIRASAESMDVYVA
jgi:type IV secretory pathway VirB3-like protein